MTRRKEYNRALSRTVYFKASVMKMELFLEKKFLTKGYALERVDSHVGGGVLSDHPQFAAVFSSI